MDLFVGIDGGGTRSTAVVVDASGAERARVSGGAALVRGRDPAAGAAALADLAVRALEAAGAVPPAAGLCCALAGAGRGESRRPLAAALQREAVAARVRIMTDAEAAFHHAFGAGPGILLIAGTGSIAWGRAADGRTARAGGWGALLGDEGSAYALGLGALRAGAHAHDGRGGETALREAVLREAGVASPDALIAWADGASKAGIAALAPAVCAVAETGDAVARALVHAAARDLAAHVAALERRLAPWPEPPGVALAGGLVAPGRPLRDVVRDALRALDPPVRPLDRAVDAARGAAEMARGE